MKDEVTKHESYGQLSISRWTSGGSHPFYGSELRHDRGIRLEIHLSENHRGLNKDRFHARESIFRADMTEAQFAQLICSPNIGSGVPITIKYRCEGPIREMEPPPFVAKGEQLLGEMNRESKAFTRDLRKLLSEMTRLVDSGGLNKTEARRFIGELSQAVSKADGHMPFILGRFAESMQDMVTEATATLSQKAQDFGLAVPELPQLPAPEPETKRITIL